MVKDYLATLKNAGDYSWTEISNITGLPESTIRKIFSGETADPRFETVQRLVSAMGGSLDEISERKKGEEPETNAVMAVKEVYEARIQDIKASEAEYVASLKRDKRVLTILSCVLGAMLLAMLLVDLFIGSVGWVRY